VKRREFLASLAAASVLPSARAGAQQKVKVHRLAGVVPTDPVSVLSETGPVPPERAFFERLRQLGFVDGQNLKVMRFSGEGHSDGFDEMVKEVVNLKPDVIFVTSTRLLLLFKQATTTIPIVSLMAVRCPAPPQKWAYVDSRLFLAVQSAFSSVRAVRGLDGQAEVVGDDPAAFTTNEGE
jgi:hypothetical protein